MWAFIIKSYLNIWCILILWYQIWWCFVYVNCEGRGKEHRGHAEPNMVVEEAASWCTNQAAWTWSYRKLPAAARIKLPEHGVQEAASCCTNQVSLTWSCRKLPEHGSTRKLPAITPIKVRNKKVAERKLIHMISYKNYRNIPKCIA